MLSLHNRYIKGNKNLSSLHSSFWIKLKVLAYEHKKLFNPLLSAPII